MTPWILLAIYLTGVGGGVFVAAPIIAWRNRTENGPSEYIAMDYGTYALASLVWPLSLPIVWLVLKQKREQKLASEERRRLLEAREGELLLAERERQELNYYPDRYPELPKPAPVMPKYELPPKPKRKNCSGGLFCAIYMLPRFDWCAVCEAGTAAAEAAKASPVPAEPSAAAPESAPGIADPASKEPRR